MSQPDQASISVLFGMGIVAAIMNIIFVIQLIEVFKKWKP